MEQIKNMAENFKKYQFLMQQLILRDFKRKYKRRNFKTSSRPSILSITAS